jgi:hypothetical protein
VVEEAQRAGRQAVAAALVPREARLVDEDDVAPSARQLDRCGHAARSAPDDQDVGLDHGAPG